MATLRNILGRATAMAAMAFALLAPQAAMAQRSESRTITISNPTQTTAQFLYLTPILNTQWGPDRLGQDTLGAGDRFQAQVPRAACRFDLRVVYEDGKEETQFDLNLCRTATVTLTGEASEEPDQRDGAVAFYFVANNTRDTLSVLNVRQRGQTVDVLGATTLGAGHGYTGRIARANCTADIEAQFEGGRTEERAAVNLCRVGTLAFGAAPAPAASPPATATPSAPPSPPRATGQAVATAPGAPLDLTVRNSSSVTVQVINIRPTGTQPWGEDRLGADVVAPGATFAIRLARTNNGCQFDVRIVYDRNQEETRTNQNLCSAPEIAVTGPTASARGRGQRKAPERTQVDAAPGPSSRVTIVNRSATAIDTINISSSRVTEWGENRIANNRLAAGASVTLTIERDGQCDFDIRVEYQGGRDDTRMQQNICTTAEFRFNGPDSRVVEGGGPADGVPVALVNEGAVEIREIYLSTAEDTHWGDDRLGAATLPRRARLELRLPRADGCRYDMRIVYVGSPAEERRGVDLCASSTIGLAGRRAPGTLVSTGTGFYVTNRGHILTNHHVIDGCGSVALVRPGGERVRLTVRASDEDNDLALLTQEGATTEPLAFRAGASESLRAGDRVVLVGYPVRQTLGGVNVTEGLISSLRGVRGDVRRFQYTAPTQAGNSGGPVMDASGLVVGVVVSQLGLVAPNRPAQNINFGIGLDAVRAFLARENVTVQDEPAGPARSPADILERSLPRVLPLDCLG